MVYELKVKLDKKWLAAGIGFMIMISLAWLFWKTSSGTAGHQLMSLNKEMEGRLQRQKQPETQGNTASASPAGQIAETSPVSTIDPVPAKEESNKAGKKTVNINTATEQQLIELPGIGKSKAKAILAYRQQKGTFRSIRELLEVKGIGEKMLAKLIPYMRLNN
ncbi:ComEA family DNA-binding protein [Paenibacillus larvae]